MTAEQSHPEEPVYKRDSLQPLVVGLTDLLDGLEIHIYDDPNDPVDFVADRAREHNVAVKDAESEVAGLQAEVQSLIAFIVASPNHRDRKYAVRELRRVSWQLGRAYVDLSNILIAQVV